MYSVASRYMVTLYKNPRYCLRNPYEAKTNDNFDAFIYVYFSFMIDDSEWILHTSGKRKSVHIII